MSAGLYIHVPFCSVKCFYCDFTAFSGQGRIAARYLAALEAEARLSPPLEFETLYVGGGTPSELSAAEIQALLAGAGRGRWREATFEANPESLDEPKLEALRRGGVDRLSLGLQTADDALLKSIGRKHDFAQFSKVYRAARRLGGFSIGVDLMYGQPGQSLESCLSSLEVVLALEPDHLSLYGLQVEDRTLFAKRGVETDEELGRAMFDASLDRIAAAGLVHYEISNFARPGHRSAHNLNYWRDGEYLGLGCGAASFIGGVRSSNLERLNEYCATVEAGRRPTAESESLSGKSRLGERAMLGLREIEGFEAGPELEAAFAAEFDGLERRGLVRREGPRRRLTRDGLFLANEAFREFVAPFKERDSRHADGLHAAADLQVREAAA